MATISLWNLNEPQGTLNWVDSIDGNTVQNTNFAGAPVEAFPDPCNVGGTAARFHPGQNDSSLVRDTTPSLETAWKSFIGWLYIEINNFSPVFCKSRLFPLSGLPDYELFQKDDIDNTLEWHVRTAVSTITVAVWPETNGPGWHLFAVYDNGSEIGISIDAKPFTTVSYVGSRQTSIGQFAFGVNPGVGSFHLNGGRLWRVQMWDTIPTIGYLESIFANVCGPPILPIVFGGPGTLNQILIAGDDLDCKIALARTYGYYTVQTGELIWAFQVALDQCADWLFLSPGLLRNPAAAAGSRTINTSIGMRIYEQTLIDHGKWTANNSGTAIGKTGAVWTLTSWQSPVPIPWMGRPANALIEFYTNTDTIDAGSILELAVAPMRNG